MVRASLALILAAVGAAALASVGTAAPVNYSGAPAETATLAPGPNLDVARSHCGLCHSVDYITTQPRSFADPRAAWTAEVAKMRKAYGAPLTDEDAAKIVDYLVATYGR
jgi:sulfite dehydrogenase (cytochrome) subunit B